MTAVMILGMHRSGTSLVTRVLNIAGAYLGEQEDLLPYSESNSAGHWENIAFMDINEGLLRLFGGTWLAPPLLPPRWLEESAVQGLAAKARVFVAEKLAPHPLWALKDPRATLLLPFWRQVVDCPRFVLCMRNPLDVAASLAERDGLKIEHTIALWHFYTLCALRDTQPSERRIVFYDAVLSEPERQIESLLTFVGAADHLSRPDVRAEMDRFVDRGLEHHHHTLKDLQEHPHVFDVSKSLYTAIVQGDERAIQKFVDHAGETLDLLRAVAHNSDQSSRLENEIRHAYLALEDARAVLNTRSHRMADKLSRLLSSKKPRGIAKS